MELRAPPVQQNVDSIVSAPRHVDTILTHVSVNRNFVVPPNAIVIWLSSMISRESMNVVIDAILERSPSQFKTVGHVDLRSEVSSPLSSRIALGHVCNNRPFFFFFDMLMLRRAMLLDPLPLNAFGPRGIEFDIELFFPQIDWNLLEQVLARHWKPIRKIRVNFVWGKLGRTTIFFPKKLEALTLSKCNPRHVNLDNCAANLKSIRLEHLRCGSDFVVDLLRCKKLKSIVLDSVAPYADNMDVLRDFALVVRSIPSINNFEIHKCAHLFNDLRAADVFFDALRGKGRNMKVEIHGTRLSERIRQTPWPRKWNISYEFDPFELYLCESIPQRR